MDPSKMRPRVDPYSTFRQSPNVEDRTGNDPRLEYIRALMSGVVNKIGGDFGVAGGPLPMPADPEIVGLEGQAGALQLQQMLEDKNSRPELYYNHSTIQDPAEDVAAKFLQEQ